MKKRTLQFSLVLFAGVLAAINAGPPSQAQRAHMVGGAAQRALIEEYCIGCHNQQARTAGISLEGLDFNNVGPSADVWEKVLRKVRTGQMPPSKLPRPDAPAVSSFVTWLESALDRAAAANPDPGRPSILRMNRAEYSNAIRDLLAVDINPGLSLPVDD